MALLSAVMHVANLGFASADQTGDNAQLTDDTDMTVIGKLLNVSPLELGQSLVSEATVTRGKDGKLIIIILIIYF